MQIIEEIHYILKVDGEELRVLRDALLCYIGADDEFSEGESRISVQLLNTIAEMI